MQFSRRGFRWALRFLLLPLAVSAAVFLSVKWVFENVAAPSAIEVAALQMEHARGRYAPVDPNIVLIAIRPETIGRLHLAPDLDRVPRRLHAQLIDGLDRVGAKCALFDLRFFAPMPGDDPILANSLRNLRDLQVTLITQHDEDKDPRSTPAGYTGSFMPLTVWPEWRPTNHVAIGSVDAAVALASNDHYGIHAVQLDPGRGLRLLHASLTVALQYAGLVQQPYELQPGRLSVGRVTWPLDPDVPDLRVNWTRSPHPFTTYEYADALAMLRDPVKAGAFRDKLILVGDTRGVDLATTTPFGDINGVDFVAEATNTALLSLDARTIEVPPSDFEAWCILLGMAAFLAGFSGRAAVTLVGASSAVAAAILAPFVVVPIWHALIPVYSTASMAVVCTGLGLLASQTPLARLHFRPSGVEEEATALFLDLIGSTEIVNRLGGTRFYRLMANLQDRFEHVVRSHGGTIERTTGDGFLAIFRGNRGGGHALRCAMAVRELQDVVADTGRSEGLTLAASIGVESGLVSGGYVNEDGRRVWTSTGATVNLAHRLQTSCHELGIPAAFGPRARSLLGDSFELVSVKAVVLKGFDDPIDVASLKEPEVASSAQEP